MKERLIKIKQGLILVGLMIILLLTLSFVSANTLVIGKIYNSDFSKAIENAEITVNCGGDILNTASLIDGSYAVVFNTTNCDNADNVIVSALKDNLYNEGSSVLNNLTEKGDFISIANLNLKTSETNLSSVSITIFKKRHSHSKGWFMCGNTVCDSGETNVTCPEDCVELNEEEPEIEEPEIISEPETGSDSGANIGEQETETQESQTEQTINLGITGAIIGEGKSGKKTNILLSLGALVLVLIIGMIITALIKGKRKIEYTYSNYQ